MKNGSWSCSLEYGSMRSHKPKNVIFILHSSFYILHLITASARFFTLHSSLFTLH